MRTQGLSHGFAALACRLEFLVPRLEGRFVAAFELVFGAHESNRAVQAHFVIVLDVACVQTPRIVQVRRCFWADTLGFYGFVLALDFTVALRIKRRSAHMRHAAYPDELLEVLGEKMWTVVQDDSRAGLGKRFFGPLQNDLDLRLFHRFVNLPMHDKTAASVQHAAQVVKRAANVDVRHIHVPVLVRQKRLHEARAFLGGLAVPRIPKGPSGAVRAIRWLARPPRHPHPTSRTQAAGNLRPDAPDETR